MSVAVLGTNEFDAVDRDTQQVYLTAVTRLALARIPDSHGCE